MKLTDAQAGATCYYVPRHLIEKSYRVKRMQQAELGLIERVGNQFVYVNFAGQVKACNPEDLYAEVPQ